MHEPIPSPAAAAQPISSVTFSGKRPAFRRLVVRGGLLDLVTLGFYRFWLATDIRRPLWSPTSVHGDPAEYNGRATEFPIGLLVAMALLGSVYLPFFLSVKFRIPTVG